MEFSFEGSALDPSKCSKLTLDEKRELVYQVSKCSGASEMLQSWSRQEILQILCVEMGKERKYTGLTKLKMIEHLLKLVSEKKSEESKIETDIETQASPSERSFKRQRKTDTPSRISYTPSNNNGGSELGSNLCCKNSACRAMLKQDDEFCKRCSCCICFKYDDNKDPSLWLTCGSELPFEGVACGMSCHLDCALKHENSGIGKDGYDGSFRCIACWKVNDLLGCWKKQLLIAKETRRVDILCYRMSLSQKLLNPSGKYQKLYEIVEEAVKLLQDEVGPVSGLPVKMGRGIVNRLSSGPEIQKNCALALESLHKIVSTLTVPHLPAPVIRDKVLAFNEGRRETGICEARCFTKNGVPTFPAEERSQSPATNCSSLSNPSSVEDETNHNPPSGDQIVNRGESSLNYCKDTRKIVPATDEGRTPVDSVPILDEEHDLQMVNFPSGSDKDKVKSTDNKSLECVPSASNLEANLPITPCKLEIAKDLHGRHSRSTKGEDPKRSGGERVEEECVGNGNKDRDFEYYVKMIRWLECDGHLEKNFRQKFLTWYSLRATPQEIRVVKAFVDTFIQDPASLAEQLVDTFSECVSSSNSSRKVSGVPAGFCMKLWH